MTTKSVRIRNIPRKPERENATTPSGAGRLPSFAVQIEPDFAALAHQGQVVPLL